MNNTKKILVLTLISVVLLMAAALVNAQSTATVTVNDSTGGTTDVTGTTTYPGGSQVTLTAMPEPTHVLSSWVILPSDGSGDMELVDNPVTFTVAGGVTYTVTPVFIQPLPIPSRPLPADLSQAAIVVILSSAGGTTNPAPGTYALADATIFNLQATPSSGWQFSHWTIYGTRASHGNSPTNWTPTDNPYNVNHGYGDLYQYQAVFTRIGSTEPTPTATPSSVGTLGGMSNETWIIIGLVIVIVVILIGFGVYAAKHRK